MSVYLDTSVVVPFFLNDPFVARARAFLGTGPADLCISDFVAAEFASVLGIRIRMNVLTVDEAKIAASNFDLWTARAMLRIATAPQDVETAEAYLRRFDLNLRTPDAINIAIAQRIGAELATFDQRMGACAEKLGVGVVAL